MKTYWDEFLEQYADTGLLPLRRRELLHMFYVWLVEKGVIV